MLPISLSESQSNRLWTLVEVRQSLEKNLGLLGHLVGTAPDDIHPHFVGIMLPVRLKQPFPSQDFGGFSVEN